MTTLAQEIFTTTTLGRVASDRLAASLDGAPAVAVSCFWAMVKSGVYSVDEMIERIGAVRMMAK